jgi:thiosulfate/3-mercaptopyruvate sulfurtransferase
VWGEKAYVDGHIPGAVYAGLDRDLAGPTTGTNGRHPLPAPETLAATFRRLGIGDGAQVVTYDQDTGMYAARLWWELRWLGHDAVAVLDGGYARWLAEDRQIVRGIETRSPAVFTPRVRTEMVVDAAGVDRLRTDRDVRLIDARAPERFRGDEEPIDRVAGHIPGAANHFYRENLNERGTFRPAQELRARFRALLGEAQPDRVVSYCGSGVTACHNLLALEHAGLGGGKLYPGSWSEWSSDPAKPTARSDDR